MILPHVSFQQNAKMANQFMARHHFPRGNELPQDIENLIDRVGCDIGTVKNLFINFGVKGSILKRKTCGFAVVIDDDHYEKEEFYYRFTLAEELAHVVLHSTIFINSVNLEAHSKLIMALDDEEYHSMESQARVMASHFLFPHPLFKNFMFDWVNTHLTEIKAHDCFDKNELANFIAVSTCRQLLVSRQVVYHTLMRFPDAVIDAILESFGMSLLM